jgi:c-di-GMP-binding flagellar brake protein YcgR
MNTLKKKLASNTEKKSIFNSLKDARDSQHTFIAWRILGRKKIICSVVMSSLRGQREIVFSYNPKDSDYINAILNGKDEISFLVEEQCLLFRAKVSKKPHNGSFIVEFPSNAAIQDRRKDFRLRMNEISSELVFKKQLPKQEDFGTFTKSCYDISKGGLSFLMNHTESRYFRAQDHIEKMELRLDGEIIVCDLLLVNLIPIDPNNKNELMYHSHRACFQFKNISKEDAEFIDGFVLSKIQFELAS